MIMSVQDTQLFVTNVVEMTFFGDRYSVEMCVEKLVVDVQQNYPRSRLGGLWAYELGGLGA